MTRALLSIGAALVLAAAALPTSASAQRGHGGGVSAGGFARGGGAPNIGARAGGGAAFAVPRAGGGSFVAPRSAGAAFAAVPRAGGGVAVAAPRAGAGSWSGGHRRHVRRGAFALGLAAPYYYDDATPYYYADDCYQLQQVPTAWGWQYQRVYVCD
jgi:hypothetical protein